MQAFSNQFKVDFTVLEEAYAGLSAQRGGGRGCGWKRVENSSIWSFYTTNEARYSTLTCTHACSSEMQTMGGAL